MHPKYNYFDELRAQDLASPLICGPSVDAVEEPLTNLLAGW